jgi:Zn-dependent protease
MNLSQFPVNCSFFLATVDFHSPALWAVVLAWIMSVCVHELAHGVVAYLGGDHTIRERGGLTLNPLQYIDPVFSIALPIFFLLSGGIPLPGGVTHIRTDLLRSRGWCTAVALAGPASNFVMFLLFALPFHPRLGWMHPPMFVQSWTTLQLFMGAMVVLQFVAVIINIVPIPPLDGFNAIRPYFDLQTQEKFNQPQVNYIGIAVLFFVILKSHSFIQGMYDLEDHTLAHLGFDQWTIGSIGNAFNKVMFNE